MRNVPITFNVPIIFIAEDAIEKLNKSYRKRDRAAVVAQSLGVRMETVVENWPAIEEHKWFLSERLGRDTGDKVAALDYLQNLKDEPIQRQSWTARIWQ